MTVGRSGTGQTAGQYGFAKHALDVHRTGRSAPCQTVATRQNEVSELQMVKVCKLPDLNHTTSQSANFLTIPPSAPHTYTHTQYNMFGSLH